MSVQFFDSLWGSGCLVEGMKWSRGFISSLHRWDIYILTACRSFKSFKSSNTLEILASSHTNIFEVNTEVLQLFFPSI